MIRAYYTATNGAMGNQNYLDVLSNNIANVQTDGFKKSKAEFSDLLYTNIKGSGGEDAKVGSGIKLGKVDVVFNQGSFYYTGQDTDYAIEGDGFFAVQFEDNIYFTRGGNFEEKNVDGENYLMYQGGYVLDENEEPIIISYEDDEYDDYDDYEEQKIGVFTLENNSDLRKIGNNLFEIANEDAEYNLTEQSKYMQGFLESSGVEIADEMVKMLQVQRAFQLNSKVIQTSDEIEQTINSLRG
nr:flagellar hook-basal body protein [Sedimentibacter sp.]